MHSTFPKTMEQRVLESAYMPLPESGPYLNCDRFENPKENTKSIAKAALNHIPADASLSWCDIACGNGEMIYHFAKSFPNVAFTGYDYVQDYIDLARSHSGLSKFNFECAALDDVDGQYDVVSFFGIITTFWDYEPPINKLLSLCKPGGLVMIDGYFSDLEVELRTSYMDKSAAPGKWRRDWSIFTKSGLREFLKDKATDITFYDFEMGIELLRDPNAPHINVWTFKDGEGKNRITNGSRVLLDDTLMVVRKS